MNKYLKHFLENPEYFIGYWIGLAVGIAIGLFFGIIIF